MIEINTKLFNLKPKFKMASTGKPKVSPVKSASKVPIKATKIAPKKSKCELVSDSLSESNEDDSALS